jgi:hypothetical protein
MSRGENKNRVQSCKSRKHARGGDGREKRHVSPGLHGASGAVHLFKALLGGLRNLLIVFFCSAEVGQASPGADAAVSFEAWLSTTRCIRSSCSCLKEEAIASNLVCSGARTISRSGKKAREA